jgi:superfamily I DNA/RNA helicase
MSRVYASTLDGVLEGFLLKLSTLEDEQKKILNLSDENFNKKAGLQSQLFEDKDCEVRTLIKLFVSRYPYILIDEIQDIRKWGENEFGRKIVSPKYKFLELIKNHANPNQLIIVGDDNQYLSFNESFANPRFDISECRNSEVFPLVSSIRKDEFSGLEPGKNLSPLHEKIVVYDAILKVKDTNSDVMIILNNFYNFKKVYRTILDELFALNSFVFEQGYQGSHALPQVIINSIFWYKQLLKRNVSHSLESTLLPFKGELRDEINFSYFKMCYYADLSNKEMTFNKFLTRLLEYCNQDREKVKKLDTFHKAHIKLHRLKIHEFRSKVLITTINSAKGLEADEVYYFMNGEKDKNYEFVAKTRHKQKLYIVDLLNKI